MIHGIRAFTPIQLRQGEGGHPVITASEAAFSGIGHHAPYCASKAAAVSLAWCLRSELVAAQSGVGVTVVCPGAVDTQIHRAWRNRPADHNPLRDPPLGGAEALAAATPTRVEALPPSRWGG